jgi:hypothetical protein
MVVQNIIPDKILLVEFQSVGPRGLGAENKTLPLRIQPPGSVNDPRPGPQFPQIDPAGPQEGYFHRLPHRGSDRPGVEDPRFGNFHRGGAGRRLGDRGQGNAFPDRRGRVLFRGADIGRGRRRNRGGKGRRRGRSLDRGLNWSQGFRFDFVGTGGFHRRFRLGEDRGRGFREGRQRRFRRRERFFRGFGKIDGGFQIFPVLLRVLENPSGRRGRIDGIIID